MSDIGVLPGYWVDGVYHYDMVGIWEEHKQMQDEIARLRAALREIVDCPQERHRADGDVEVYYNAATMLKIAREALGDE